MKYQGRVGLLIGFGVMSWIVPFVASIALYPLKATNEPLFETIVSILILVSAGGLGRLWYRTVPPVHVSDGFALGTAWLLINVVLDQSMLLSIFGPQRMPLAVYLTQVGLKYLIIPIVLVALAPRIQTEGALRGTMARSLASEVSIH
ncbi:MAG TPA: hypothetical protein VME66_07895 [Candidatus Acidoferrales bacterium]|nr:hypothetical protein [Candidatus Acidoferrales bacterium]